MLTVQDYILFEEANTKLITLSEDDVEKLASGEDIEIGEFVISMEDDEDTIETDIELDVDENFIIERRIRQTKRMKNSNKVVSQTTKELFGEEGKYLVQVKKIFKLFKQEVRQKAKEMGVPVGQVRKWRITLKDYDDPKLGTKI